GDRPANRNETPIVLPVTLPPGHFHGSFGGSVKIDQFSVIENSEDPALRFRWEGFATANHAPNGGEPLIPNRVQKNPQHRWNKVDRRHLVPKNDLMEIPRIAVSFRPADRHGNSSQKRPEEFKNRNIETERR